MNTVNMNVSRMTPNQGSWLFKFTGLKFWEPEEMPAPTKNQAERGLGYAFAWSTANKKKDKAETEKQFNLFVQWAKEWFPNWEGESLREPHFYSGKKHSWDHGGKDDGKDDEKIEGSGKKQETGEGDDKDGEKPDSDESSDDSEGSESDSDDEGEGKEDQKESDESDGKDGKYRIMTLEEMKSKHGEDWKLRLSPSWHHDGLMDYLLGTALTEEQSKVIDELGKIQIPRKQEDVRNGKYWWTIGKDSIVQNEKQNEKQDQKKEEKKDEKTDDEKKHERKEYKPENDPAYEKLRLYIKSGIPFLNIFLVGAKGCGKTTFPKMLGKEFDLPVTILPCSSGTSPQEIRGFNWPKIEDSPVSSAVSMKGIIVLDEFTMLDASTAAVANSLLANNEMLASTGLKIRDPNCIIIVTANTMGHGADRQYVGNNQLDAATLDRFAGRKIIVDYNRDYEATIGDPEVCRIVWKVRDKVKENGIRKCPSTRSIINATADKKAGMKWWKDEILDDFNDIEKEQIGEV